MTWFTGVLLYVILWWLALFMVLPWGARPPETPETGHEPGAPARPMLLRKALATSLVAAIAWIGLYALIQSEAISLADAIPKK